MKSNVGPVLLAAFGPYDDPDEPKKPGQQPMAWSDGSPICFAQFVDQRDGGMLKCTIAEGFDQTKLVIGHIYNCRLNMTFEAVGRATKTKFRLLDAIEPNAVAGKPAGRTAVAA